MKTLRRTMSLKLRPEGHSVALTGPSWSLRAARQRPSGGGAPSWVLACFVGGHHVPSANPKASFMAHVVTVNLARSPP
jgi:hypothetical protein